MRARYNKYNGDFPIAEAVDHILSDQITLQKAGIDTSHTAEALGQQVIKQLGASHSAKAALACFQWLADRFGALGTPVSLYEAAISACTINFAAEDGLKVFEQMQANGKSGSLRMYNMIIASCCNAGTMDIATEVRDPAQHD